MNILVITQYFYPENFRINDIVSELVKRNHSVTVITGRPNYPSGEVFTGYEDSYKKISYYNGAKIYRCKLRPRHRGFINLALNYLSFILQTKKVLKNIKPEYDIVFFYELSPITSAIPALKYGKKYNIPTIIYDLDIWPESIREIRENSIMSKKNPIYIIVKRISKKIYSGFDIIVNKCDEFTDYLNEELNIDKSKMITIEEHAEDIYLNVNDKPYDNGIVDFMFLGNIGSMQMCDKLIYAFEKINRDNIKLHFVGSGSDFERIRKIANNSIAKENIVFHGKKSIDEINELYNLADVCLLALSNKTKCGLTPPAKLMSYMASSRPIIAAIDGAAKRIIRDSKCGIVCDSFSIDEISEKMIYMIDNKEKLFELGLNGRNYYKCNYNLKNHMDKLENLFIENNKNDKRF